MGNITQKTMEKAVADQAKMSEPPPPEGKVDKRPKSYDLADGRVAGLELRVRPRSVRWSMRTALHGKRTRFDLGPAVEGSEDVDGLSVDGARSRAARVAEMARHGHNPATFLAATATGVSIETQRKIELARPKPSWSWEKAKKAFLDDVERTNREDTLRDYRGKLRPSELDCFNGRMVDTITRNEMAVAVAVAVVHARGKEAMADGMVRVIKRFFNWMAESVRQDETHVADGVMVKLKTPDATREEIGEEEFDPEDEVGKVPPEIEIGRVLAIARLGCMPERVGLGIQLLTGTVQRRRAVTGASRWRFKNLIDSNDEAVWFVPPFFRKSGTKRGQRSHLVPVVGFAAHAQERLDRLSDFEGSKGWLFPAGATNKSSRPHAEAGLFNDYLEAMPGVSWSPHDVRYAFATYGERDLGFAKGEGKLILDHMEGVDPKDVTSNFYSSDPGIARKRQMMRLWTDWCDEWTAKAIAEDSALLDADMIGAEIRRKRYQKPAPEA
jgi:hypothetical protein